MFEYILTSAGMRANINLGVIKPCVIAGLGITLIPRLQFSVSALRGELVELP